MTPQWHTRADPLAPVAVCAVGPASRRLAGAGAARRRSGAVLRAWTGADLVLLVGAGPDLPWVEGATYLGRDRGVLVPTTRAPRPGPAVLDRLAPGHGELVVLPDRLLRCPPVGPADPDRLAAYAGEGP